MEKNLTTGSVGQTVGARDRRRAALAAGFGILTSITVQFTAESIVALFTDPSTADGAAVVHLSGQYLRGYILTVSSPASISASAATSAPAGGPGRRSRATSSPSPWYASPAST